MRILLTGATGFIGSAVLKLAASQGHEVAALVRPEKTATPKPVKGVRWLTGTLADAPWGQIIAFHPVVCIHAAWITTPGVYLESPENDQLVVESEGFIKRAVAAGARRAVALGTCIEYQITGSKLAEEITPLAPVSRYARSKDALRRRLEQKSFQDGFHFNWGRVFYPYGPGEHPARLCSAAIQKLRAGQPLTVQNSESVKDYIYIEDLASAIMTLAGSNVSGPINLGTGIGVSVGEVARTLGDLLGHPGLIRETSSAMPDPFNYVVADASRLRALGWAPKYTLREGLQKMIQHTRP
jgi:nucleoside-diphosphate-sugar epimerase